VVKNNNSYKGKKEKTISQNSHFTMSSARKDAENESNSIISEEDSAFEDFSPKNALKGKKRIEQFAFKEKKPNPDNEEPSKMKGIMANEVITSNRTYRNNEKLDIHIEQLSKESTIIDKIKKQTT